MAENRQARDTEVRASFERPQAWRPPESLPSPNPEPGWAFRWIRTSLMGQDDAMNASAKFREGWTPVKAEDYPYLNLPGNAKGNIETGGLVLCKIPAEFMDQRAAYYTHQTASQMEAVDNNFMRTNDERMPLFQERKSNVSFGRGTRSKE
jgi:hypothetical protein